MSKRQQKKQITQLDPDADEDDEQGEDQEQVFFCCSFYLVLLISCSCQGFVRADESVIKGRK
jgi:hypothetical protein